MSVVYIIIFMSNCRCLIRYGTKVLLPQYDSCTDTVNSSTVQYPTISMVKHLIPDSDVAIYLADTFLDTEQNITIPSLNINNGSYSTDIAAV